MSKSFNSGSSFRAGKEIHHGKVNSLFEVEVVYGPPCASQDASVMNSLVSLTTEDLLILRHRDEAASDNGKNHQDVADKGRFSNEIACALFELIANLKYGHEHTPIKNHYIGKVDEHSMLIRRIATDNKIPLEVIVRNRAYGSLCRRYGIAEGVKLEFPTCEFCLKNDAFDDPLITSDLIRALGIASAPELEHMRDSALTINKILKAFFAEMNLELIDFKLEFGRMTSIVGDYSSLLLIGDLSPDVFRLRDQNTGESLDKDIFRKGLPGLASAYERVSQKISRYQDAHCQYPSHHGDYDKFGNPLK